ARIGFGDALSRFQAWRRVNRPRSHRADRGQDTAWRAALGNVGLDAVAPRDIARVLDGIAARRKPATRNPYRSYASPFFTWAIREALTTSNPVRSVPGLRENNARQAYLSDAAEAALRDALAPTHRPHFLVSIHTGMRWSEQMGLRWRDVDFLTGFLTIPRSKHGEARRVPMNAAVRGVLLDLATARIQPDDPDSLVFEAPGRPDVWFVGAVERAREALMSAEKTSDALRLDGYTWHGNRHTFGSRLVTAGVHLRTVQELGGWKPPAMVTRYAHLAPDVLKAAVERLVPVETTPRPEATPRPKARLSGAEVRPELARN